MSYIPAIIQSLGTVLGIVGAAYLATSGYRSQKDADRRAELEKQKADTYVRYLNTFWEANRWAVVAEVSPPEYDRNKHEEATERYRAAFNDMFLTASKDVLTKAYEFYTLQSPPSGLLTDEGIARKKVYAKVLLEMRKDAFLPTDLNPEQIAQLLP